MENTKKVPRGIRNNNPGNIRTSELIDWIGEVDPLKKKDPDFEEFRTMAYGVRAMMKLLLKYQKDYKLNTINELVGKYAPRNENNTNAYIERVCNSMQCSENQIINLKEKNTMCNLVDAMIAVENSVHISMKTIEDGWNLM